MRVVATRSADELVEYVERLAPRFEVVALPLLTAAPPDDAEVEALLDAVAHPGLTALWLASARAVAPVVAALQTRGIAAPPAYTVGERTGVDGDSTDDALQMHPNDTTPSAIVPV